MLKNKLFLENHNKIAAICGKKSVSYKEVLDNVGTYMDVIFAGHTRTKKVAIYAENRLEWLYAFYASWAMGYVPITIDHLSTPEELAYILQKSEPELVFISNSSKPNLDNAYRTLSYRPMLYNLDSNLKQHSCSAANLAKIKSIGEDIKSLALIIFTSGTTGSPKGVMLSFENILVNIVSVSENIPIYNSNDRVLALLPLHHALPLVGSLICPLYIGATVVFTPSLIPNEVISSIADNKVTIIIGVPKFYEMVRRGIMEQINAKAAARALMSLSRKVDSIKFARLLFGMVQKKFGGSLRYLVAGGAAMNKEVGYDMRHLGFEILEGYGMTEAAPMISFTRPGHGVVGSPGPALPGCEIKFEQDEIAVRGPNVMLGYYNNPEDTAAVLRDGWLYTGDKGYLGENAMLYITGRTKEIIVLSNGKNINPIELEFKLLTYDTGIIQECAIFEFEDSLSLIVYPNAAFLNENSIQNVKDYIKENVLAKFNSEISHHNKITNLFISDKELPKTRLAKIKRFMLPEIAKSLTESFTPQAEPQTEEFAILKKYFADNKNRILRIDSNLEIDLGLDSLDKISLLVFVNSTFGTNLAEEEFSKFNIAENLLAYIHSNKTKQKTEEVNWSDILHKASGNISLPKSWLTQPIIIKGFRLFANLFFRVKAKGRENLPNGPFILASNHQSLMDAFFVSSYLKNSVLRKTYFYAKRKHVQNFFLKFLANTNNVIVMDINKDVKSSMEKLASVLQKGRNLIIFPEGTRSLNGALGEFKKMFAILSSELNVPIVPVAIDGAYQALPSGTHLPKPFKKITIEYLKPIYPESLSYESLSTTIRENINRAIGKKDD